MFDTSPIEACEGAAAFFNFGPDTFGAKLWFWISVVLCIVPLWVSLKAENAAEDEHGSGD